MSVASRSLAAVGGGYLAANLFVPACAGIVPLAERDARQLALMLSFVVFALAAIWAFSCRTAFAAWAGILGAALLFGAIWAAIAKGAL